MIGTGSEVIVIALSKLYPIYSLQTSAFYTDEEAALDERLQTLRKLIREGGTRLGEEEKKALCTAAGAAKQALKAKISENIGMTREVRKSFLHERNIVCIFDSDLTRSLKMCEESLNDAIVIVKVFYFGIAESIIKNGFTLNGERYIFFSASAGQIRTKKFVAVKESLWQQCRNRLTCGLSLDRINAQGGINVNKYLAYLALCNSATDLWKDFDIDKCIVVEDFETNVRGLVDFITTDDFKIHRQEMDVPITHTDGCGMILPSVSKKNFMVRAPWIKGLLASFPFDKFIREANRRDSKVNHGLVRDIYGQQHDVLAEGIQIIFTKSQFKLWKHYESWDEYRYLFKKYGCTAGKCNEEETYISNAQFNYQMLQTLDDMSDEELDELASKTNESIRRVTSDRDTMLRVFGATKYNQAKNPFQECLYLYPELLQDAHSRDVLRSLKNKMIKEARGGRLDVKGKYLFLVPDLYAACQYWFLGEKIPSGLLADGEVFCRIYADEKELDCLRSPHLYREHAVRKNVAGDSSECKRWFQTDAIYTSSFDTISKILQFDNDGDKALVCAEPVILLAAKRACQGIVPLYYEMAKAPAHVVDSVGMYKGMEAAYTGGAIGPISNSISKIWNSGHPDLDAIKLLCAQNNFTIDYAKPLYKPTPPPDVEERIRSASKGRVPHFFIYAKDKEDWQGEPANASVVNRLEKIIKKPNLRFNAESLGKFDYRMLMCNPDIEISPKDRAILDLYYKLSKSVNYRMATDDSKNNYAFIYHKVRSQLLEIEPNIYHLTDVLVKQLFYVRKAQRKTLFWECFGDVVLENLKENVDQNTIMCVKCGSRLLPSHRSQIYCPSCAKIMERERTRLRAQKFRRKQKTA